MNNQTLLSQPIFQALGWALVHFIWQGALVALLYASVRVVLQRRTSNVRYAAACGAMLLMLALPITTTLVIKRTLQQNSSSAQVLAADTSTVWKSDTTASDITSLPAKQVTWTATSTTATPAVVSLPTLRQRFTILLPWLVSIWLGCVLVLSLRVLGGWIKAQRLKSWKTSPASERWQVMLVRLARRLNLSRTVQLCESVVAEVPTVVGWLRPVILVPISAFVGLSPQQIEALLAHELAHIRRYDYFVNLLQTVIETLLFYHPAVWWVSRQVRTERENCCDDIAVALCGNVLTYARALAELEQLRGHTVMPRLAVAANGGGSLLKRIQRLIETPTSHHQRSSAWLASILAIATIFCICVGARTTLFDGDTERAQTRLASSLSSETSLVTRMPNDVARTYAQNGDPAKEFQIVVPEIRANVNVIGALPVEDPASPRAFAFGDTNRAFAAFPPGGPGALAIDFKSFPPLPVYSFSFDREKKVAYVQALQDDDNAPSSGYVEALAMVGYTNLTVEQLNEMRDHGVSAGYIKELKTLGYQLPSVDMAVRLVDHGVSIGYVKKLGELGYKNLSLDALVRAVDHGVHPAIIESFTSAGFGNLLMDEVVRAVDHGVGPAFIKAMADVGLSKLSLDLLIRMRDHGVDPSFVKEIRSVGYDNISPEQFIRLRDHGVDAAFLRKAKERGFNNLSLDELIKLRDADIL